MTFSYDTPFCEYFADDRFILREYLDRKSAILWLSYGVDSGLSLSVYDDVAGRYTHMFKPNAGKNAEEFLVEVEEDYDVTIPRSLIARTDEFLSLLPDAFTVTANLDKDDEIPSFCDNCGDYNDHYFKGSYFPGFNGLEGVVEVHYNYGCFGGEIQDATIDDTDRMRTVWEIIDNAITGARNVEGENAVKAFRDRLTDTLL